MNKVKIVYIGSEVTGFNRGPFSAEELHLDILEEELTEGYDTSKYYVQGGIFHVKDEETIEAQEFLQAKLDMQEKNKNLCTQVILSVYPDTIQRSASLGIYPTEFVDNMKEFISYNIEEENRVFDEVEMATTYEELDAITPAFGAVPK